MVDPAGNPLASIGGHRHCGLLGNQRRSVIRGWPGRGRRRHVPGSALAAPMLGLGLDVAGANRLGVPLQPRRFPLGGDHPALRHERRQCRRQSLGRSLPEDGLVRQAPIAAGRLVGTNSGGPFRGRLIRRRVQAGLLAVAGRLREREAGDLDHGLLRRRRIGAVGPAPWRLKQPARIRQPQIGTGGGRRLLQPGRIAGVAGWRGGGLGSHVRQERDQPGWA